MRVLMPVSLVVLLSAVAPTWASNCAPRHPSGWPGPISMCTSPKEPIKESEVPAGCSCALPVHLGHPASADAGMSLPDGGEPVDMLTSDSDAGARSDGGSSSDLRSEADMASDPDGGTPPPDGGGARDLGPDGGDGGPPGETWVPCSGSGCFCAKYCCASVSTVSSKLLMPEPQQGCGTTGGSPWGCLGGPVLLSLWWVSRRRRPHA